MCSLHLFLEREGVNKKAVTVVRLSKLHSQQAQAKWLYLV